jgi:prevent-host-death family protein
MEKLVTAFEARRSFGRILDDVAAGGDQVVVERHGRPVAVLVSLDVYDQWKRSRSEFFDRIRKAASIANESPGEADRLAAVAVTAVRSAPRE